MIIHLSDLLCPSSYLLALIVSAYILSLNFLCFQIILDIIDSISHICPCLNFQVFLNLHSFSNILYYICFSLTSTYNSILILLRHNIGRDAYPNLEIFIFNLQLVMVMVHIWVDCIQVIIIFLLKDIRIIIHIIRIIILIFIFPFLFFIIFLISLMIWVFDLLLLLFLCYAPWIILLVVFDVIIIEVFLRFFDYIITPFDYTSILNKFTHCLSLMDLTMNLPAFILLTNR